MSEFWMICWSSKVMNNQSLFMFCFHLSHRRSTTVSLETRNPFIYVLLSFRDMFRFPLQNSSIAVNVVLSDYIESVFGSQQGLSQFIRQPWGCSTSRLIPDMFIWWYYQGVEHWRRWVNTSYPALNGNVYLTWDCTGQWSIACSKRNHYFTDVCANDHLFLLSQEQIFCLIEMSTARYCK